jgi:DNA segregation ATPase FtsK/SpoIIIE, S-DNA-T family
MLSLPDRDAVVRCEPDDTVGAVVEAALARPWPTAPLFTGTERLDPRVPARSMLDGAAVRVGGPGSSDPHHPPGTLVAAVVTGPSAGTVVPLDAGRTTLGRVPPLELADHDVSRRHVHLDVDTAGVVTATDAGSTNGTTLDGRPLTAPAVVGEGALLWLGHSAVVVRRAPSPDAAVRPDGEGGLLYNRPPRLAPPRRARRVPVPTMPTAPDTRDWPVVMVVAPLVLGVVMALVLKQPAFLLFILLSPVMLIASAVSDRRKGAKGHRAALRTYRAERETAEKDLRAALEEEVAHRRRDAPDPAELLLAARGPSSSVWHRHRMDQDFLELRLGVGDLVPDTEVKTGHEVAPADTRLFAVPVTVRLPDAGALGVAGPRASVQRLARWCVGQAALLHSPRDVEIVLFTAPAHRDVWEWVRWLPHLRGRAGGPWVRLGVDEESARARVAELTEELARRGDLVRSRGAATVLDRVPTVLVVLDGARGLRNLPGMGTLLADGPPLGVVFLCLDDAEAMLPRECTAVAAFDAGEPNRLVLRRKGLDGPLDVVADQVGSRWSESVGRALAPLRDADPSLAEGALPTEARLTDLAGLTPPRPDELLRRWSRAPRSTVALLGASAEGAFALDMADGPHALIAGTTGAGKSGLLQTLVASLAVANRPDALNVLLIDYKGGAAFRDCARLPHCVGVVTDLDAGATSRALTSLRAELKRREKVLDDAHSPDIGHYWTTAARRPGADPLPRLAIVIDEFAQLVTEMPEFVTGLVDVAARGRSLGIHLVLATQQPAGVVNNQIRSNTTIRISLRVADETSSTDVVGIPDAGRLPRIPGRAFVKIGAEAPVAIQTARTDTSRPGTAVARRRPTASALRWETLGRPLEEAPEPPPPPGQRTDLSEIVDAVREAARVAGVPVQRSPWQPPLPALVPAAVLRPAPWTVPYGLEDVPDQQRQHTAALDLRQGGHLAVIGAPRSGRSTLLRTVAGGIGAGFGADDVHLFVVDCGGAALRPVADLPHCGAVVSGQETDRVERLLTRLLTEVARRQRLLSTAGVADLTEYREVAPDEAPPYLVLLLDGYEGFVATFGDLDGGRVLSDLHRLLRDGPAAGLRAVLGGDRSVLVGQTGSLVSERLVLRLASETDYAYAGLSAREVPEDLPAGRAVRAETGTQIQVAVLGEDPSGRAQSAALAEVTAAAGAGPEPRVVPMRVDPLPDSISPARVAELPRGPGVLLGVGGDELAALTLDPASDGSAMLVHGPRRSGRSTLLAVMARDALATGGRVVTWTTRASALQGVDGAVELRGGALSEEDLLAALADGPALLLVDDVEAVSDQPAGATLTRLLKNGGEGHTVVVAGATDLVAGAMRGPALEAARGGLGLVLCPHQPILGAVFTGAPRVPRSLVGIGSPGRGVLLRAGELTAVQVPAPDAT